MLEYWKEILITALTTLLAFAFYINRRGKKKLTRTEKALYRMIQKTDKL